MPASASTFENIQVAFSYVQEMLTGNNHQPSVSLKRYFFICQVLDRDRDHADRFGLSAYESKHLYTNVGIILHFT